SLESKSKILSKQSATLEKELGKYSKTDVNTLTNHLDELLDKIESLQLEYEKLENEIREKSKTRTKLETNIEEHENSIESIHKLGSKCPVCESKISDDHKEKVENSRKERLNEIKLKLKTVLTDMASYESRQPHLKNRLSELENKSQDIQNAIPNLRKLIENSTEIHNIEVQLEKLKVARIEPEEKSFDRITKYDGPLEYLAAMRDALLEYQNAQEKIETIGKQIKKTSQIINDNLEEIETKQKEIKELHSNIQKLKLEVRVFEDLDKTIKQLESEDNSYQNKLKEIAKAIATQKQILKSQEERQKEYSEEIIEAQKWQKVYQKYSKYHEWIKNFFIPASEMYCDGGYVLSWRIFSMIHLRACMGNNQ
ncbi:MAG: hypothetical protein KGL95_04560, partial [Patescibacteria group bacterium]|nr:hypothetical protein [Patescibacteria group bacterium]